MVEVRNQVTLSQYLYDRRDQTEEQRAAGQAAVDYQGLQDVYDARAKRNATIQPPLGRGVGLNAQVGNPARPSLADFMMRQNTSNRAVNPTLSGVVGHRPDGSIHGAVIRNAIGAPATVTGRSNQQIANDRAKRLRERRASQYQRPDAALARRVNRVI